MRASLVTTGGDSGRGARERTARTEGVRSRARPLGSGPRALSPELPLPEHALARVPARVGHGEAQRVAEGRVRRDGAAAVGGRALRERSRGEHLGDDPQVAAVHHAGAQRALALLVVPRGPLAAEVPALLLDAALEVIAHA